MTYSTMKRIYTFLPIIFLVLGCSYSPQSSIKEKGPYMASGIKIGEVTDSSAIIWVRLTKDSLRVDSDIVPEVSYYNEETKEWEGRKGRPNREVRVVYPQGKTIVDLEGAVPGVSGEVRLRYRPLFSAEWETTDWVAVDPQRDYTHQFAISDLISHTRYLIQLESRSPKGKNGPSMEGGFWTAPTAEELRHIMFTVSTGQAYPDKDLDEGYKIYGQMLRLNPSFFVHTGDILYYDHLAKSQELARWHWARMYSLPTNYEFHRQVSSYFIKDDHDAWMNDCWPGQETKFMGDLTFEQGLEIFKEQVPMRERTYRTIRWGKDLQIWLVEGRDYRSPNTMPDGPEKTIWGTEQKQWFKETVQASDATFRILISPTPIVGPDRENKKDNHSNDSFAHEGNEIREFIASQKNMVVICGDRHWQYISQDAETGVREYSCGPASNEHAGGWKQENVLPEHEYLNVTGGFLSATVDRKKGKVSLTFRHYSVDGEVLNEDVLVADEG